MLLATNFYLILMEESFNEKIKDLIKENLYSLLEIQQTDDNVLIKKSYKKLIKKYHPDKNKSSGIYNILNFSRFVQENSKGL